MKMKRLLVVLLGLNVLLLGVEVYLLRAYLGDAGYLPPLVVCIPAADQAGDLLDDATLSRRSSLAFDYGRLESPDFKEYIDHLRSLGCPDETIRGILIADMSDLFRGRTKGHVYTASRSGP
jgi:hypothetical protein